MAKSINTSSAMQELARIYFVEHKMEQKLIAEKVGVSANTVLSWVKKFNWKAERSRMLAGKKQQLNNWYAELDEIDNAIKEKPAGKRYADTKMADVRVKIVTSIRQMETETGISELVDAGTQFIQHLQLIASASEVIQIAEYWDDFITSKISTL